MMRNNEREIEGAMIEVIQEHLKEMAPGLRGVFSVCPGGSGMRIRHPNGQTGILYRGGYPERKPYSFAYKAMR